MNKEEKKMIGNMVILYFMHNPKMDKGIGFRIKANEIITKYYINHNMKEEDIRHCIESQPMCQKPIWDMFYDYWFKNQSSSIKNEKSKSQYKNSIGDSTNADDWI